MRIASLVVALAADISALQRGFAAAVTETNRMVARIQAAVASIGLAVGIREIGQYADAWVLATGRIRLYSQTAGDAARIQEQLFQIAQDTRSEFEQTATLYTRLAQGARELGLESQELLTITRAVGNALRLSNASTAEQVSVMRQLSQAFSSGRFQGDELRSIIENSAVLGDVIARSLGVTVGKLRELGAEGKILPKQVAEAILAAAAQIEKDALSLPTTIGQAFTQLSNSIQRFIGLEDKAGGVSRRIVAGINAVGKAFDENRPLVEAFVLTLGTAGLVGAIVAVGQAIRGLAVTQAIASIFALGGALGPVAPLMLGIRAAAIAMWSAIIGPLSAIALIAAGFAIFFKIRKDAEAAREEMEKFREEMGKLSKTDLTTWANATITRINSVQKEFDELRTLMSENLSKRITPSTQQVNDLERMRNELETLREQLREVLALRQKAADPIKPSAGGNGGAQFDFKAFIDEGQRLLDFFDDLRERRQSTFAIADDLVSVFQTAEQKLAALKDPLSEEAAALRKFIAEIRHNAEAMAVINLEKARIQFPVIPEIEVPPLAVTEDKISDTLRPIAAAVGAQFGQAVGDAVATHLRLQNMPKLEIVTEFIPPTDADFRNLQAQIERLTTKQGLVDLAKLTNNKAFEAQAISDFKRTYDLAVNTIRNFAEAISKSNLPLQVQVALLFRLGTIAKGLPQPLDQAADGVAKFVTAGRGIVQIASQFSNLNRNILQMVGSILDATAAIKQFNDAKKEKDTLGQISGALGVAGAAVSFGAAIGELLFGAARRAQKELESVVRENTRAIAENNLILRGFNNTLGAQTAFLQRLEGLLGPAQRLTEARDALSSSSASGFALREASREFADAIKASGFTIFELDTIAKRFGITLLDTEGRIIPQAFQQLRDQIHATREALFQFETTVADVTLERRLRNAAANIKDTPEQIISDSIQDFRKLAPELADRLFAAIDFSDGLSQSELAEIRRQSQQLVEDFFGGLVTADDLPGFETPEEFAQFVLKWLDALNGMADAANEVTKALVNVPQGFKIERARFLATVAETIREPASFDGVLPTTPKTKGLQEATEVARTTITQNVSFTFESGSIVTRAPNGDALFEEVKTVAKRKVRAMSPSSPASDAFDL